MTTRRRPIPCPAADDLESAPQLVVVALADAALLAIDRALDCAHPILAVTKQTDRPAPYWATTERVAAQVLELSAELAVLLHDYADAVRVEGADFDDDIPDPF